MSVNDLGVASGPGSSPSGEAPTGLPGSAASIPNAGDWVLFRGSSFDRVHVTMKQAEKVTAKQVRFAGQGWPRLCSILDVVASFPDQETAERVRQSIDGVAGEFDRRRRAAEDERSRRITEALAAANRQIERIVTSAMSTGTAKTPQAAEGRSPASAIGNAETPNPTPDPTNQGTGNG